MANSGKILVIGGYGQVGLSVAKRLAPLFPDRIAIAGRSIEKATSAAGEVGYGAEGRLLDIFDPECSGALDNVALVLVCLDQSDTRFVEQCLSRAIHYVDISADYQFLSKVEKLDQLAKNNGATAILSVGVAPGITNMLAARAASGMEQIERIDILLVLGLGDQHGKAALEWMFDNLDAEYEIMENGRLKTARSLGKSILIRLPRQQSERRAYSFNFSDQRVVARTLGVPSVSTWIHFENNVSTWLFAISSRVGLGWLLRRSQLRKFAVWLFMNVHTGSDICGVAARATGQAKDGSKTLTVGLTGRKEALMTAIVTAETVRQLLSEKLPAGVLHSEQAIKLDPVINELRKELPDIIVST